MTGDVDERTHPRVSLSTRRRLATTVATAMLLVAPAGDAANVYVEDFTTTTYMDPAATTADWNTVDGELKLFPFVPTIEGSYDTPDNATDVAISGDLAFVAGFSAGLQILDIANPAAPVLLGTLDTPGFAIGVAVSGDLAFVADYFSGLQIIDITDPSAPALVGTFSTPGTAWGVAIDGDLAFVADQGSGLQIVDIADPSTPALAGSVDTPGTAYDVAVAGNVAYVADDAFGLQAVDISDPTTPAIVGVVDTPGLARGVAVSGDNAFVGDGTSGLQVIDISDPTAPTIVGNVDTPGEAWGVVADGDRAYVADSGFGLQVVDVSVPASPMILAGADTPGAAIAVAVAGSRAFVADQAFGLQVVDVWSMAPTIVVGSVETLGVAWGVAADGDRAYVTYYDELGSGLQVVDIADPTMPLIVGSVSVSNTALSVVVTGNVALVTNFSGLQVIDISDPASPAIVGSVNTPDFAWGVAVTGDVALVADSYSGLQVIDITDPTSPTIVGSIGLPDIAWGVAVAGDVALVAVDFSGLFVVDITDPTSPTVVGSVDTPGEAYGVAISGDLAFVTDRDSGLFVVDITDPTSPAIVGSVNTPGEAFGVSVTGDMVFVADSYYGMQTIDIADPTSPTIVGTVDTPGAVRAVAPAGGVAFVADGSHGLQVVEFVQDAFALTDDAGQSLPVDTADDVIVRARLSSVQWGSVSWELSANGGATFAPALPGATWTVLTPGDDLVWHSTHTYVSDGVNPTVSDLTVEWLNEFATITRVADIPYDQGRQVRVEWQRSGHDFAGDPSQVIEYAVYRKIDEGLSRFPERAVANLAQSAVPNIARNHAAMMRAAGWDYLVTVPVLLEDEYAAVVPTLRDSTAADGQYYSTFRVTALTATPGVFFHSYPDSGYSVDNLAPGVPAGLMLNGAELSWEDAPEEDFQHHSVYGSAMAELDPSATLIGYTVDPTYDVSSVSYGYYHVTTSDHAGNEGDAASVEGDLLSSPDAPIPTAYALSPPGPNPLRSGTSLTFALPEAGKVRLVIYDTSGRTVRTLANGTYTAAVHRVIWDVRDDGGRLVGPGVYFARITAGTYEAERRLTVIR